MDMDNSLGASGYLFEISFSEKMLGAKYRYTFVWFYLGSFIYGHLNQIFLLAGTIRGNFIYLCSCALLLNALLFQGSMVKKSFFTLWMYCASGIVYCAVFPMFHAAAVAGGAGYCSDAVIDAVSIAAHLAQYLMMEILQQRLHVLKRDFADQDAFYLMHIIVFIYAAISMMQNMLTGIRDWPEGVVFAVAVPCSLIGAAGAGEEDIAAVDICCLPANALDNAIEACERGIQAGAPVGWIRMKSRTHTNYWVLEISNSIHSPIPVYHGKILSSKRLHFTGRPVSGVGLQNIRAVVERYEGVLEVKSETAFTINVMLPVSFTAKKNPSASL